MRTSIYVAGLAAALTIAGCDSSGTPDGGCQSESDQSFCTRLGKNCDSLTAFDNCGDSRTVSCGTCYGACLANVCDTDAGPPDAGPPDAGPPDAGPPDAGPPDAGCPAAGCPEHGSWFQGDFTLTDYTVRSSGCFDGVMGESLSLIASFEPGTPMGGGRGTPLSLPPGPVHLGFAGDTSGFITGSFLPRVQDQPSSATVDHTGSMDFEVLASNPVFTLELFCAAPNLANDGMSLTLVSDTCSNASVIFRRFDTSTSMMTDYISGTGTNFSFHYDGGP
jgi:hypothetical protein